MSPKWCLFLVFSQENFVCISHLQQARYESYHLSFLPLILLLSLAPQLSLGLGLLHKIRLNFLEASQEFSFLQGRVVSPTPNPHPRGPGLCIIYIPRPNNISASVQIMKLFMVLFSLSSYFLSLLSLNIIFCALFSVCVIRVRNEEPSPLPRNRKS
jgi:hypothetical protein